MVHRITDVSMMKFYLTAIVMLFHLHSVKGQKYFSKVGQTHFLSEAPLEKIEADNNNSLVVLDAATGQLEWSVLIKGFQFVKALMQDHFNENYMESYKFPKGLFKGTITNIMEINLSKDGSYVTNVKGDLTLHGVTKPIMTAGQITVKNGKITAASTFDIIIADYNIDIPKVVRDNLAKTVKVTVRADLQVMH